MSKAVSSGESKLSHLMKAPVRALRQARDLYESGMAGIASKGHRGPIMSSGPRSHGFGHRRGGSSSGGGSSSSSEDELNELIRAACKSKLRSLPVKYSDVDGAPVPRSHSVATMRIDEDQPCCFDDDLKAMALGPRSKSYDVAAKRKLPF